jgi:hypothetical protein
MRRRTISLVAVTMVSQLLLAAADPAVGAIRELYYRAGWEIPGLTGAKIRETRGVPGAVSGLTVDILEPTAPRGRLKLVFRMPATPNRLEFRDQPVEVQSLWRFSRYGHVYAYRLTGEHMGIEGDQWVALASETTVTFLDQDGSGKFSVMRYQGDVPDTVEIPGWVRDLQQLAPGR